MVSGLALANSGIYFARKFMLKMVRFMDFSWVTESRLVMRTGDGIVRHFMMAYTELAEIHEEREVTKLQLRNILIGLLKAASQIAAVAG